MNNNWLPTFAIWHANVDTSHGWYCECKGLKENHFINHLKQNIETNVSIRHGLWSVIAKSMTFRFIIQGCHFTNEWNNRSAGPSLWHNWLSEGSVEQCGYTYVHFPMWWRGRYTYLVECLAIVGPAGSPYRLGYWPWSSGNMSSLASGYLSPSWCGRESPRREGNPTKSKSQEWFDLVSSKKLSR